jgi:hypothetical protein
MKNGEAFLIWNHPLMNVVIMILKMISNGEWGEVLTPDFNKDLQWGEVPTPYSSFNKVPDDSSLRVRMSGGESHIYNETPNNRSHIDKSRHADTPNVMPTDKSKHAAMPAVASMHTDGVKPPPPPEPPPVEPPPIFNFIIADHLVICAIYAFYNYPLDEPSWKDLIHIAKWETKFTCTCMINKETLRSYNTAPVFTVPKTY